MQLRWLPRARAAAAALALAGHALVGQSNNTWLAGVGLSVPAGSFASYADNGWDLTAGWEHHFGRHPTAFRVDFSYATNTDTSGVGYLETTRLINAMASLVYHFDGARPHLYALIGVGEFSRRFSSEDPDDPLINDSRFGLQVGEGVVFTVHRARLFLEGRFVTGVGPDPLRFFPVVLGVRLGGPTL